MVSFVVYDLIFMSVFILFIILFLTRNKKNLTRQGLMFLYRTQFGVRFIDKFAKRFEKVLKPMRYVVLFSGYMLTITIVWLIGRTTHLYLTTPIAEFIRAPPIAPTTSKPSITPTSFLSLIISSILNNKLFIIIKPS